jgi:hypothetical protein
MRFSFITLIILLLAVSTLRSQNENVGIGTTSPHPSAKLEVHSTTQGILIPRMTCEQRDDIESPADGLLVFITDTCDNGDPPGLFYFSLISLVWKPVININLQSGNTLDESYDEGGDGAGRMITVDAGSVKLDGTAANTTLEVSNTSAKGIDVNTTTGIGVDISVAGGDGIYITNTVSEGIEVKTMGTGRSFFAENITANADNVMEINMGGTSGGTYYDIGGRAGYFTLLSGSSPRPALHGHTLGSTYGVLGMTDVFSNANLEPLPSAGIAGLCVSTADRNGVSGLARGGTGVWGRTAKENTWSALTLAKKAGVFGQAGLGFGQSGENSLFAGLIGYTVSGMGVIAHNEGVGHGVVGIAKGASATTQAGVWGMVQEGEWAAHTVEFPWLDGASSKGKVAILGQAKFDIGIWAESQDKIGLVATIGPKYGSAGLPSGPDKIAIVGTSAHAEGIAGLFANTVGSTKPTMRINSLSSSVGLHLLHDLDGGRAMIIQNALPTPPNVLPPGGKQALIVQQNICDFSAVDIRLDCDMSMASAMNVSHLGKGKVVSISQLNAMSIDAGMTVLHAGLGKTSHFEGTNAMNTMPSVEIVNAGKSNGLKITNLNDMSTYSLFVENVAGSPGAALGGVAHFKQSAGSTAAAQTVLISSSTTTAGHKTLVVTPADLMKTAAEFNGKVDILGDLTTAKDVTLTTGKLEVASGDLEVGNDATIGGSLTVTEGLTVSGSGMTITGNSTINGNLGIVGTMTAATCVCPSDIRYKHNIVNVPEALAKIDQINGVYYDWKTQEYPDKQFSDERQIGLIAQELEAVFPELVYTGADGYKSVNYAAMTAVLVEAIKEQQRMIEELRGMIVK